MLIFYPCVLNGLAFWYICHKISCCSKLNLERQIFPLRSSTIRSSSVDQNNARNLQRRGDHGQLRLRTWRCPSLVSRTLQSKTDQHVPTSQSLWVLRLISQKLLVVQQSIFFSDNLFKAISFGNFALKAANCYVKQ